MRTYPIMLDVSGRPCAVVGAGPVGLRKAAGLARAGAAVRLIDPSAPDSPPSGVEPVREPYRRELLDGAVLVFACTNDASLNARVAADARAAGAWVNAADDPAHCDFYAPATIAEGDVVVAVGTGGSAPALAAELKRRLARHLPERAGEFAEALARARRHVRAATADPARRARILKRLAGAEGHRMFLEAGPDGLIRLSDEVS